MLQREIRLKEVQDATYDDMCRLLNERKLCNVERCTGMGKTTIFLRYIREHPDETVLYFYDTDDIKNKIKTDGKDVLLMSYQKLFRTAASSVITYLEDKDIDIINKYYIKPVSDGIRCKLPHSLQSLSDFEIFTQYYNI